MNVTDVHVFVLSQTPVVCRRNISYLRFCFVFAGFWWCPTHIVLRFCFVRFLLVYLASLDCPFWITPSVCFSVYIDDIVLFKLIQFTWCKCLHNTLPNRVGFTVDDSLESGRKMFMAVNEIYHWLLFNQNAVGIKISKINIINDDFSTNSKVQFCTKYFNLSFEVIMYMHMHTFPSSEWISHVCATILYVYVHHRN